MRVRSHAKVFCHLMFGILASAINGSWGSLFLNAAPAVRLALNRGKPQESSVQNRRRSAKKLQNH